MATFAGAGLASVLASWESPVNVPAAVFPGEFDHVLVSPARILVCDISTIWGSLTVTAQAGSIMRVDLGNVLTIRGAVSVQNFFLNDGVVIINGNLTTALNDNANMSGVGLFRIVGANATATLARPGSTGRMQLSDGGRGTLTADRTFDELTIDAGCTFTVGAGGAFRSSQPPINNGSMVLDNPGGTVLMDCPDPLNPWTVTPNTTVLRGGPGGPMPFQVAGTGKGHEKKEK